MANKDNGKIVKIVNKKSVTIELTPEQLELKKQLIEVDQKVAAIQTIAEQIASENKDTVLTEDVVETIVGMSSFTAITNIISEYFGLEKIDPSDLV